MAIYANLREYTFKSDVDDIRGSDVYGTNDEKLGKVDDVIFDRDSGDLLYVVIDTGGWLTTSTFLVPAREIMDNVEGDRHFRVNLTREQIERFPAYKEDDLRDERQWRDYEQRYQSAHDWQEGPVLHREGSTHTITPTADEMPATGGGASDIRTSGPRPIAQFAADGTLRSEYDYQNQIRESDEVKTPESRPRWREFQERLRREREQILRRRRERDAA